MVAWRTIVASLTGRFLFRSFFLSLLSLVFLSNCGFFKPLLGPNPKTQHYLDLTRKHSLKVPSALRTAIFAVVNWDERRDLITVSQDRRRKTRLHVFISGDKGKFSLYRKSGLDRDWNMEVRFIAGGDLNGDRTLDLVLIGVSGSKSLAKFLFNNKRGYFYSTGTVPLPPVHNGIERVDLVDIDRDHDLDLFFTGRNLLNDKGRPAVNQAQIMLNNGHGQFTDASSLLLPPLRAGIVGTSIADYDGDDNPDIFLVYGEGQNVLLINNGLGKFSDMTNISIPEIQAESAFADWADFDLDGDNDLLVVTSNIHERYRAHPGEFSYFLENDGHGRFVKRSLKLLPQFPSHKVYLLDADANKTPDIIILSQKGVHFLIGEGDWEFSDETLRRFPYSIPFKEMTFGDVNQDGALDIFGITAKNNKGRLWVGHFD